jgi:hypothetical protein
MTISLPFLEEYLGLGSFDSESIYYSKILKDLSLFRRYSAKFIAEYEMFLGGDISSGENYGRLMSRYTGFFYQPESHLFDLAPEFYSLDYVLGWMAEAIMQEYLMDSLGPFWMFREETGLILRQWWSHGNKYNIFQFLERNKMGRLSADTLIKRWNRVLN